MFNNTVLAIFDKFKELQAPQEPRINNFTLQKIQKAILTTDFSPDIYFQKVLYEQQKISENLTEEGIAVCKAVVASILVLETYMKANFYSKSHQFTVNKVHPLLHGFSEIAPKANLQFFIYEACTAVVNANSNLTEYDKQFIMNTASTEAALLGVSLRNQLRELKGFHKKHTIEGAYGKIKYQDMDGFDSPITLYTVLDTQEEPLFLNVTGTEILVSDPCGPGSFINSLCHAIIPNCKSGKWMAATIVAQCFSNWIGHSHLMIVHQDQAQAFLEGFDQFGDCPESITGDFSEFFESLVEGSTCNMAEGAVQVESGMCGFFDAKQFNSTDEWYKPNVMAQVNNPYGMTYTVPVEQPTREHIMGVFTDSGSGDTENTPYKCTVVRNAQGQAYALMLTFLEDSVLQAAAEDEED